MNISALVIIAVLAIALIVFLFYNMGRHVGSSTSSSISSSITSIAYTTNPTTMAHTTLPVTTYIQNGTAGSQNLYLKKQELYLIPGSSQFSNFTVPSTYYNVNISGSFISNGTVQAALLNQQQFVQFIKGTGSLNSSQYYYGSNYGTSIYSGLPPGQYTIVFYNPGKNIDNVTITDNIVVRYIST